MLPCRKTTLLAAAETYPICAELPGLLQHPENHLPARNNSYRIGYSLCTSLPQKVSSLPLLVTYQPTKTQHEF